MSESTTFTAEILETSASAYASYAAHLLLERHPDLGDRSVAGGLSAWKTHLTHRILELSAAVGAGEPALFTARVLWADKAFQARDIEQRALRSSLDCLRQVLTEELPEIARDTTTPYLDSALGAFDRPPGVDGDRALNPLQPTDRLALQYLQTALEGDSQRAIDLVIGATEEGLSTSEAYLDVLLPAQQEIGRLWHSGDVRIAEEHLVTSTTERIMSILAYRAERLPANGKTVIASAVAGNSHQLGVRVLADFFGIAGWRSICLGADVPPADLATAVVYFDPDLLVLSAALATQLKTVRQTIEAVRMLPDRSVKILVGGSGFADAPELWRRLGADGQTGAADAAVELGARLVG